MPVELQPDAPAAVTADDRARAEKLTAEAAGVPAPEPPAPPARGFTYRPVRAIPLRVDATTREEAIAAAIRTCPSPPGWTARPIVHAVRPAGAATAGPEASGRPPPKR